MTFARDSFERGGGGEGESDHPTPFLRLNMGEISMAIKKVRKDEVGAKRRKKKHSRANSLLQTIVWNVILNTITTVVSDWKSPS